MPGTILLGIDVETASENAAGYARYGAEMYHELGVPVTWYVTGMTLELYPEEFKRVDASGLIELQSHTYSHMLLKTVLMQVPDGLCIHDSTDFYMGRGGSNEEIDEDLGRCQRVFLDVLGRPATALCGPWGYYRGLGDRPDLLEIVDKHGFRILRTFGRNEKDAQPVPLGWQPFLHRVQGYPQMLEVLIHDYQDDFYWRDFTRPGPGDHYTDRLRQVADRVAAEDLVWSMASHDHGCGTREGFEQKGVWLREIIRYSQDKGIRFLSASDYYEEMLAGTQD